MPVLKNPRHEQYARAIFQRIFEPDLLPTNGHAYRAAGYKASLERYQTPTGATSSAEVQASKALRDGKILDRVRELQAEAAAHAKESVEKVVKELNEIKVASMADSEKPAYSAAVSAVMGKAKVLGLITDKVQTTNEKPDFAQATSLNDIGRMLLESVGYASPSDAAIAEALEAHRVLTERLEAIAACAGASETEH